MIGKYLIALAILVTVVTNCRKQPNAITQSTDEHLNQIYQKKSETIKELQGTWVHVEDNLAIVKIENTKWAFSYEGDHEVDDQYDITLTDTLTPFVKKQPNPTFILLINREDTMKYEILTLTDKHLSLMFYPRGNIHTYKKRK